MVKGRAEMVGYDGLWHEQPLLPRANQKDQTLPAKPKKVSLEVNQHRCPFPIGWLINRGVCFTPLTIGN